MDLNSRVVFASHPGVNNAPTPSNFKYETFEMVEAGVEDLLTIRTLYLSVDPAQRCQMNGGSTGVSYIEPWALNEVVPGLQGVGVVVRSDLDEFAVGDIVTNTGLTWPWQKMFHSDGKDLKNLREPFLKEQPNLALNYFGIVGLTALIGIQEKGHLSGGEVVVVSGAAGATGSLAGQFARLAGCRIVVGICGSDEKCRVLTDELAFSHAINYKEENFAERLRAVCSDGIDCYFDNVGGSISNSVIASMNPDSHIVLCGQIATYNTDAPYPPPIPADVLEILSTNRITRDRFLVLNYMGRFEDAQRTLARYLQEGHVQVKETVSEGLCSAGDAFCGMMAGKNVGKQLIRVSSL